MKRLRIISLLLVLCTGFGNGQVFSQQSGQKARPSETPANFQPTYNGFEYDRRDVMIPMRDGVNLHTVILVPRGAKRAPILLTRTPYNATELTSHSASSHLGPI